MEYENYTPLSQFNQSKKSSINFFILIFFLFSSFFLIYAIAFQPKNNTTTSAKEIKKLANLSYQNLYEISFPINRIENQSLETKNLIEEAKELYPHLNEKELIYEFNKQVFSFVALVDYFQKPLLFPKTFKDLLRNVETLKDQYLKEAPIYSGFLIKIRYKGYYGKALENIKNLFGEKEIKSLAEEKIKNLINKNLPPDQLKNEVENDEEIKILNNMEKAFIAFEKDDLYPPPFDDPNFCVYLQSVPLNKYSNIFELKTFNYEKNQLEEYAFLVFYLNEKKNNNLHLDCLINQKIKEYHL